VQERTAAITALLRAIFPATVQLAVEYVAESHSTEVYRVHRDGAVLYLRVLPEQAASFAPELYVHDLLHRRGLHVPGAIYFAHCNALLQRSILLTTEIPGRAIGYGPRPPAVRQMVRQAGRELAIVNSVLVRGFGWIKRDQTRVDQLSAECDSYAAWLLPDLEAALAALTHGALLSMRDAQAVRLALDEAAALFGGQPAYLAHGDFDVTHIYHQDGRYTGMIDFGEIRGANQLYDVGHFQIENADLLPDLLEGYADVVALPADHMRRILLSGLLIGVRRLGRSVARSRALYSPDLQAIRRTLVALEI
jgi:aminoglycoside phosphotransferase (APT) family kinase protein